MFNRKLHLVIFICISYYLVILLTACNSVPSVGPQGIAPTPVAGLGNVKGRLLATSTGGAYRGGDLFLGRVLRANRPDAPPFVAYSSTEDIKSYSRNEETGDFFFINVPPGEYALVLDLVITHNVLEGPNTHSFLIIKVEADKTLDLNNVFLP